MISRELEQIQGETRDILARYLSEYPVKLGQLAEDLGVVVKVSNLNTGVSGQIKREGDHYLIRVNRYEARERQRFTIAHELAHFLLHKSIIDSTPDGIKDNVLYRSGEPERIEFEANRLAADIVMPMDLVEKAFQEDFEGLAMEATIESLAARFQVSKAAKELISKNDVWDGNLNIWGEDMIYRTSINEEIGIDTPQKNVAARVNIHLHRQAFHGEPGLSGMNFDEDWED